MSFKRNYLLPVLILITALQSCLNEAVKVTPNEQLTLAIDMDMPGYFALDGENFGYQYDLLKAYADSRKIDLQIISGKTTNESAGLLKSGEAHFATTLHAELDDMETIPLYSSSYTVLTDSNKARSIRSSSDPNELWNSMSDSKVLISAGFKASADYEPLFDSLPNARIFVSSRNCFDLLEELRDGVYDFLICEKSEAQLGCALISGVSSIYEFTKPVEIRMAFGPGQEELRHDFSKWLAEYRNGTDYALLTQLYFENGKAMQLMTKSGVNTPRGNISPYDRIMREVCEREGFDWRLISAIAYSESRFKADVVSNRGAKGLMQIMPATASQFNVSQDEIFKPEINIMLATKLLGKIESMLRFPSGTTFDDKMRIILACYNCGIGHVLDARRLASKYGGDPNSWEDVSLFLQRKAEPEYIADDAVSCGTFKGSKQTLAFVNDVMVRYSTYCERVSR